MSAARELLHDLDMIGATIEPSGDQLILRAGPTAIPACLVGRIREAKAELLALLDADSEVKIFAPAPWFERVAEPVEGEPGLDLPYAARRGRVQELDGLFLHYCIECGAYGAFGYDVSLRAGRLGRWYCGTHRPGSNTP